MKLLILTLLSITLFTVALSLTSYQFRDRLLEIRFDFQNENATVTSTNQINKALALLQPIKFSDLDQHYLHQTNASKPQFKKLTKNLTYFQIHRKHLHKKIVADFRFKDFVCKDNFYKSCILNNSKNVTCIFNKKIFYKTLELIQELEKAGYNKNGFQIVNGHRHPKYNEQVGGASLSRHIKGEAVDIVVLDINHDGRVTKRDKEIVIELLENKIIGDEGGIGLYPGTDNLHYDVRGTKARWDSY